MNLSVPSLRADNFSRELMQKLKSLRKSGLTFAPEAGTQRLRDVINKNLTEQEILELGVERREINVGFAVGDTVKIIDGPLEGFLGTVDELDPEGDSVRLIVSMFGRETPIDLELDQVEPVKED